MTNKCKLYNCDCMELMKTMENNSVNCILTDIPYDGVSRVNNGLSQMKNSDKGNADIITFDLQTFLDNCFRLASDNIIIFCGRGQFSDIYNYFDVKPKGTVRPIVWRKTNPVPSNGKYIYLSGVEFAVWYKKPKGTFNAFCKNTVFDYPIQSHQIHPTEKNHKLIEELILDNTNEGQVIFDPCMGSASTGLMALKNNRKFIGCELDLDFFKVGEKRLKESGYWEEENSGE